MPEEPNSEGAGFVEPPLGEEIRRQREMRQISIREISDRTKISSRFLEAIEKNEFEALPAPVFTRGFIREYARELGLDPDDLVDRYMQHVKADERREERDQEELERRISGSFPMPRRRGWLLMVAILLIVAIAAVAGWYFLRSDRRTNPPAETATASGTSSSHEVPAQPIRTEQQSTAETEQAPPIRFEIQALETSWLKVSADGHEVLDGFLAEGETRKINADQEVRIESLGNAGGVRVVINGVQLDGLGRSGQVIKNRVFDREFAAGLEKKDQAGDQ